MPNNYYPNSNFEQTLSNQQDLNLQFSENILRKNIGKRTTIYMSFPDSIEWRDKTFTGIILDVGRDFILIKTEENNQLSLLWNIYINYIEFKESINF